MASSDYNPEPPPPAPTWDDIVVGCFTARDARVFALELKTWGVDVTKVDDRSVYVPWRGDPNFLFNLFQLAVDNRWASDVVCAAAQRQRLNEVERRARWS